MYIYIYIYVGREGENGGRKWWGIVVGNEKSVGENGGETAGRWASTSPCLVGDPCMETSMPCPGPMPRP